MEILLALMLMIWNPAHDLSKLHEHIRFDHLVQAVERAREYGSEKPKYDEVTASGEWIKRDPQQDEAPVIRGVYASAHTANGARMQSILQLLEETELNAIVIDIKEDEGYVTYETGNREIEQYGTTKRIIRDIGHVMDQLEQRNIYPIARIVVFKDKVLARQKPEWSFLIPMELSGRTTAVNILSTRTLRKFGNITSRWPNRPFRQASRKSSSTTSVSRKDSNNVRTD